MTNCPVLHNFTPTQKILFCLKSLLCAIRHPSSVVKCIQMKVLTIRQPYASLILSGRKTIEFRSWPAKYRGPLAIHAGKGIDKAECRPKRQVASTNCEDFVFATLRRPRSFWPTLVVSLALSIAAGCGGGSTTTTPPPPPAASEFVFSADQAASTVRSYRLDTSAGSLTEVGTPPTEILWLIHSSPSLRAGSYIRLP